jgi:hypothetical protein
MVGKPISVYDQLSEGTSYVLSLIIKENASPKVIAYGLSTGNMAEFKLSKKYYNFKKFSQGDIVRFGYLFPKPKLKFVGKDDEGKPIYEPTEETELWCENYQILKKN